jgi:hypothetical protein
MSFPRDLTSSLIQVKEKVSLLTFIHKFQTSILTIYKVLLVENTLFKIIHSVRNKLEGTELSSPLKFKGSINPRIKNKLLFFRDFSLRNIFIY